MEQEGNYMGTLIALALYGSVLAAVLYGLYWLIRTAVRDGINASCLGRKDEE